MGKLYVSPRAEAAFEGLAAGTKQGRPAADVLPNFQKYLCGSHVVYSIDAHDQIDVIRALHQRQYEPS